MGRKKKKKRAAQKKAAEQAARATEQASALTELPAPPSEAARVVPATAPIAAAAPVPEPQTPAPTPVPVPSTPDVPLPTSARAVEAEEHVEDLDADLDADASDSYDSLVAKVAGLPDEPRRGGGPAGRKPADADVVSVEEVDEVIDLDDDDGAPAAVHRLIAQAGVGAPVAEKEEAEEEIPVIDLDADEAPPPRASVPGRRAAAPSAPVSSRLVEAAAAGGIDDPDSLAIPIDLGVVSTPEARARLLAEALAHAEHKEARYRVPLVGAGGIARWKGVIAAVLFVVAGAVAVAPPAWVRPEPPAQFNAAARERGARLALLLQAQQIEAFRVQSQRLPDTLDELPGSLPGVGYARSGNRAYQLIAYQRDGSAIVYDSADPAPSFQMLMHVWQAMGAAQ